jgi:hypothetical protein
MLKLEAAQISTDCEQSNMFNVDFRVSSVLLKSYCQAEKFMLNIYFVWGGGGVKQ